MRDSRLISGLLLIVIIAIFFLLTPSAFTVPPAGRPTPTVQPAPSPGVTVQGGQEPAALNPDLVVESISTEPPTPLANVTITLRVVIKNIGKGDVPVGNNFWVDLYINPPSLPLPRQEGTISWGAQYWWLPAGASYTLTATYRFTNTQTYALYAQVDTDNNVVEADEYNNVAGPVMVAVRSTGRFEQSTHQDFQTGLASNLDLSHPDGAIRLGYFDEPWADAGVTTTTVYSPDVMVNEITGTITNGLLLTTTVAQVRPSLAISDASNLFVAWQDGRYGGLSNNRIFFARSTDGGATWQGHISITADLPISPAVDQRVPRLAYDKGNGRLYVVWQDNRNGNYDIYFASSSDLGVTWTPSVRLNDDAGPAHQMNPSLAVREGGHVYVAWQDQRNGNDDIYFTRSHDAGATWPYSNTFVTDDPSSTAQAQRQPSIGVGHPTAGPCCGLITPTIYIAWEDWRNPVHPEIYVVRSLDGGNSFGLDVPVELPAGQSYRVAPALVVDPTIEQVQKQVMSGTEQITVTLPVPMDVVHVAWQEEQGNAADVYYTWSWISYDQEVLPNESPPWPYDFFFRPKIRVNGYFWDAAYTWPPEGKVRWPIEESWQGNVALAKAAASDIWACNDITYTEGVYIAWADARSFERRTDIVIARIGHPAADPKTYVLVCNNNDVLNSNAKIYAYRDNAALYAEEKPAAVHKDNPSLVATVTGTLFLVWDDDRWDTPHITGTWRNRDVFFARSLDLSCYADGCGPFTFPNPPYGVYISPVFDTGVTGTEWYTLDWWGYTDHCTPIYFQTRTGDRPQPPQGGNAQDGWSAWDGPVKFGTHGVHTAPGQSIVSPPNRYIQYKLIIDGPSRRSAVSKVIINYEDRLKRLYLPLIFRNYKR